MQRALAAPHTTAFHAIAYPQKFAGLLYDVSAGGVPLREAALAAGKAAGVDIGKVRALLN